MRRTTLLVLMTWLGAAVAQAQDGGPQTTAGNPASQAEPVAMDTAQVQLGAFDTREAAHRELARLRAAEPVLVGDRTALIIEAESGGRVFYRLRLARLGDVDLARQLCEALIERNVSCIPIAPR